jgi:hypothetical protein
MDLESVDVHTCHVSCMYDLVEREYPMYRFLYTPSWMDDLAFRLMLPSDLVILVQRGPSCSCCRVSLVRPGPSYPAIMKHFQGISTAPVSSSRSRWTSYAHVPPIESCYQASTSAFFDVNAIRHLLYLRTTIAPPFLYDLRISSFISIVGQSQ